jgi:TolB-like protein/Tfp pilus assembly protein PilF
MAGHQNKLSHFWQELKRRRVIHVITVYASAAFVIIELIGNLTEPLNLPASLSTIVIIVLAVGFPLAIVLSWLYDLTSGTFERTKPLKETPEEEKAKVPNAWKIATYVSFVVIAGLIVLNIASRSDLIKPGMIQSLVVLPFDNYTGDENLEYVAAGMHASLIGDIGKVSALRVIGETSSNVYKETDKSAPDIAEELNVDLVLEPTLTCYGDTVCILVRAIANFPEEKQIWVAEYREDKSKILSLWNRIAKQIADEVKVELTPEEERLLAKAILVDREAYENFLISHQYWGDLTLEALNKAKAHLNSAIEKDPDWAPLYSGLAKVWLGFNQMGYESPEIAGPEIYKNLNKALELDPDDADAHYLSALIAYLAEWDWEKSEKEFLKAISMNPSDPLSRIYYSHLLYILQRPDEAAVQAQLAYELDPLNPIILVTYGYALQCAGDCENAMMIAEKNLALDPDNFLAKNELYETAARCKDYDRAFEMYKPDLQAYLQDQLGQDDVNRIEKIFNEQGYFAAYEEILSYYEIAAEKGFIGPGVMAVRYMMGDQQEKAMDCLEKGYEIHDPQMPYIAAGGYPFHSLYDNPRFIAILEKMNLPLPKTE